MPSYYSSLPKRLRLCFSVIKRHRSSSPNSRTSEDLSRPSSATSSQTPYSFNTYNSLYETAKSSFSDVEHSAAEVEWSELATAAYASRRFFFSSPGLSNSIVDSSTAAGGVAAQETYTRDPYGEFRRSMEEMVVARGLRVDGRGSWKKLHQLLLCYLSLNPKPAHPFIVAAFSDLIPIRALSCAWKGFHCRLQEESKPIKSQFEFISACSFLLRQDEA
ncbi:hypothetical protein V2J09_022081 [Rumex salicifolius]